MSKRDYEAELRQACTDDRQPGATLAQRGEAQDRVARILRAADRAGVEDIYARFYVIDEEVRTALYG